MKCNLHTVGRALPGVEIKISDGGEILVRSGSVFSGYFRSGRRPPPRHCGTAGCIPAMPATSNRTDISSCSAAYRTSCHTASGERYIPNYIENRLKFSPYIKDAAVLGRDRDRLSAIVCIDREAVGSWAEQRGISYMSYADLAQNPQVADLVAEAVRRINRTLPEGLRLHEFVCLHKEFDADDGEITRTRKIRRNIVEERYKPIIDAIYGREKQVLMQAKITYRVRRNRRDRAHARGAGGVSHGHRAPA